MSSEDKNEKTASTEVIEVEPFDDSPIEYLPEAHRGLRMRHLALIAISGSIGSALFISIGIPLTSAGPLGLLIGMALWCTVVFAAANCLIEMTTLLPVDGGFIQLTTRFVDRSVGMALGWNYTITQLALVCYDLTAINLIVNYWTTSLNNAIMIVVCLALLAVFNLWSVRWYGETEFWISVTKLFLMAGLTLYTIVTMCGGNPIGDKYGFRFWKHPGVFAGHTDAKKIVQGIWDSLCWSTFAIVGPDYISLVGGEIKSPRRVLPKAFKSTVYRIFIFYLTGAWCVGIVAASNDENLLGAISSKASGAAKSPYVISMRRLGIPVLPSIVNGAILVSCISTSNSFVFTASRSLYGLALKGQAPRILTIVNRNGVPYVAVVVSLAAGCLSLLSLSASSAKVLNWWIGLAGAAQLVTWTCIAITYLRFRAGLKRQRLYPDFLPQLGYLQPLSGWWIIVWCPLTFIFSGYYCFIGKFDPIAFVFAYGSLFIFLAIYLVSKVYDFTINKRHRWAVPLDELDFVSDIKAIEEMTVRSNAKRASHERSVGQKISDFFF